MITEIPRDLIESHRKFMVKTPRAVIRDFGIYERKVEDKLQDAINNHSHDTIWELEKARKSTYMITDSTHPLIDMSDLQFSHRLFDNWVKENDLRVITNSPDTMNYIFFISYKEIIYLLEH